jgi:integrase
MLTDTAVKNAMPADKPYKLADALGLYLIVRPNGAKWWRVDYRHQGKRKTLSAGVYPTVTLKQARAERDRLRESLDKGLDPGLKRKTEADAQSRVDTFEEIAREWHAIKVPGWTPRYAGRILDLLEKDIFPHLGAAKIADIDAPTLLAVLRRMEARGLGESVKRALENVGAVFRYAVATGRCTRDLSSDLKGSLKSAPVKHFAAIIEPKRLGQLLRDIEQYQGSHVVRCALKLTPLLALRPGELRRLEWSEVHLDAGEIRIPASKMKMRNDHIVPLSDQALQLLDSLHPLTGSGRYVFPSSRSPRGDKFMSENTVNAALRYLGWDKDQITAHGFRGTFCSLANEKLSFSSDAIERQLAHTERSSVRRAYLHTEFLPERRKLMQAWANLLDQLRDETGSNVVPIRAAI